MFNQYNIAVMEQVVLYGEIVVAATCMLHAAVSDWKTRKASDVNWAVMAATGLILLIFSTFPGDSDGLVLLVASAVCGWIMIASMSSLDIPLVLYMLPSVIAALLIFIFHPLNSVALAWISACLFPVAYVLMYWSGAMGGADVKCLMALSMMFPLCPDLGTIPLWGAGTPLFSLTVLLIAACGALVSVPIFVLCAGKRTEKGIRGLTIYRVGLEEAYSTFVQPVEDVKNGKIVKTVINAVSDGGKKLDRLKAAGATEVLVTPMIPMLVPLVGAFMVTLILGCPPIV